MSPATLGHHRLHCCLRCCAASCCAAAVLLLWWFRWWCCCCWRVCVRTKLCLAHNKRGCCCCSHINPHNQVRGHRTGSSHSGAEKCPREKHKQPKVVHAYITADAFMPPPETYNKSEIGSQSTGHEVSYNGNTMQNLHNLHYHTSTRYSVLDG